MGKKWKEKEEERKYGKWKIKSEIALRATDFCAPEGDSFSKNTFAPFHWEWTLCSHKAAEGMLFPLFAVNSWESPWGCLLLKYKNSVF